jgi:Asp-tRNA(Asn)/Glu-tRNA(Gln) amidotransferase C subunit
VVALENVLRPDDAPWQSLPRDTALAPAPEPYEGAFRVPSPQAE